MKLILLSLLVFSNLALAQTPDWRPINRVYKSDAQTIGSIGSANQIKAGHILTAKSFPAAIATDSTKLSYFSMAGVGTGTFGGRNMALQGSPAAAVGILGEASGALATSITQAELEATVRLTGKPTFAD